MEKINSAILASAMSYRQYRQLIDGLQEQHKTTGSNQSPAMLEYTRMNVIRMNRLDKTIQLSADVAGQLKQIDHPLYWLVLTEAWCGDAAQILPVLGKMAEQNSLIRFRLILRDEHPDIMEAFLTKGSRSIPKLILIDAQDLSVLGAWGPRPAELQEIVMNGRREMATLGTPEERSAFYRQLSTETQKWYAQDKTLSTQREVMEFLEEKHVQARVHPL